ncbi:MAG: hypothetical protein WCX27_02555 [Candidatus Paceibacterota bacterium]
MDAKAEIEGNRASLQEPLVLDFRHRVTLARTDMDLRELLKEAARSDIINFVLDDIKSQEKVLYEKSGLLKT